MATANLNGGEIAGQRFGWQANDIFVSPGFGRGDATPTAAIATPYFTRDPMLHWSRRSANTGRRADCLTTRSSSSSPNVNGQGSVR
jgi:hypothetical protein